MSWDSYIDNLLGHANGHGDKGCIIGVDGSLWTSAQHAQGMQLSAVEAADIGKAFLSKNFSQFQKAGVLAEGVKYQFLRSADDVVLAKKKDYGALTMQSSKTAVVICHTAEGSQQGSVNKAVAIIAEYLTSLDM